MYEEISTTDDLTARLIIVPVMSNARFPLESGRSEKELSNKYLNITKTSILHGLATRGQINLQTRVKAFDATSSPTARRHTDGIKPCVLHASEL